MASALDLLHLAETAAGRAAGYLREAPRPAPADWGRKGRNDFVSEADRTAERLIHDVLAGGSSGRIIGEELSPELVSDGLVWVVDPIDGTTNFLHGFPAWCVSVAAAVDGVLEAAVVLDVPADRRYRAWRGGGAWLGEARLRVSAITDPAEALIGTGFPFRDREPLDHYFGQLRRIVERTTGVRRPGSAALDLATVAAGGYEGFWEQRLSAWDIAAGTLLIREAGGKVTDFEGRDLGIEHGPVLAGNPAIHQWLMKVLKTED